MLSADVKFVLDNFFNLYDSWKKRSVVFPAQVAFYLKLQRLRRGLSTCLYKSLQILALDNMIKLTLITIAHSFHHKTLPKIFDNLFKYLKTSHSYNTRIRSNQNFFKPSVNTNIGKKSIQYRGVEVWQSLKLNIKLLGSTSFRTQVKKCFLDID